MINKTKTIAAYILSVLVILAAWVFVSKLINAELILPSPFEVFSSMGSLVKTKAFWQAFTHTFLRVIISFTITVVLGTALGITAGFSKFLRDFFELPLAVIRATPVVAFILIALFWFKSGTVPVFVSVLMTLPIMTTAVANGFSKADEKLMGMAKVFCLTRSQIFKYIQFPSLVPFLLNGMVSSFGLTWKVVAAGEVLSLPKYAAGTMLQKAQVHLETSTVIAVAIILVLVSFILEQVFMSLVKRFSSTL
jgi:NitT/TauT family transport system permease protein